MTGKGTSNGSITVINAMPTGIGCTIGIGLETTARFTVGGQTKTVEILSDPNEDPTMASICVRRCYETLGLSEPDGWHLVTDSDIPISRGLKSSSSACNAILRAVLDETGGSMDDVELIRLGVKCAREAGVTVTGSFDDACGCGLGGLVMTDNRKDEIVSRREIGRYDVVVHVPERKIRKKGLPLDRLHSLADEMRDIIEMAMDRPFEAMTANGRLISEASDVDNSLAEKAIDIGALGAGMSGAGPAVAMVFPAGKGKEAAETLGLDPAETILSSTR
ncbi:MAG: shikimate kinase [Candidatus Methanomethylophilaceae archaeon]|nr:shikimate kinase [Candidatus Methanomethylophilaceae archaeon]